MALEGKQFSHYRILQLIGRGGMGEVYLAEDTRVRRQVAVKVIRIETAGWDQETGSRAMRLFWREATAIAQLDHPNILPLYDHGEVAIDGFPLAYLIMPYRPEGSLVSWLRRRAQAHQTRQLTLKQVAHIIQQAGRALQYAHDHQFMHLDVKPDNFLIRSQSETDEAPDLLLTDFGIARLSSATSGSSQSVRGTPAYMAPEQCVGQPVFASDQYALAIMAYELLTGKPPFLGTPMQVMFAHMQAQPEAVRRSNPLLPSTVDEVLQRALAKKPEQRYPSVAAFAQAFQEAFQAVEGTTIMRRLPPPPPGENEYTTLAISAWEARNGGIRVLTLANGRMINVQIPPGAISGQVLTLPDQGTTTGPGATGNNIYLKLMVLETPGEVQADRTPPSLPLPAYQAPPPSPAFRVSPGVVVSILLSLLLLLGGGYLSTFRMLTGQWPWGASASSRIPEMTSFPNNLSGNPSAPGGAWQTAASGISQNLTAVAWSGSLYVAVGGTYDTGNGVGDAVSTGVILTSPDGHTWTLQKVANLPYLTDVIWAHSEFVVVGHVTHNSAVFASPDGHTWTNLNAQFASSVDANFSSFTKIIRAGSQFVALGFFSRIYTSPDGHIWTTRSDGTSGVVGDLTWSGLQFVAIGIGGTILTSPDAITWTPRRTSSSSSLNSVTWANSQFVAVGKAILTSHDGVTWTSQNVSNLFNLTDVIRAGTQFVAVGWGGQVLGSPDGITWTNQNAGVSNSLNNVAWSGSRFVAVGDKGGIFVSS
jgi:serine/threonine protein kinase